MCEPAIIADCNIEVALYVPFYSVCVPRLSSFFFCLPRNKIALTVCNKIQQNACYILYILYAYYILLLVYITKTKSLFSLINWFTGD